MTQRLPATPVGGLAADLSRWRSGLRASWGPMSPAVRWAIQYGDGTSQNVTLIRSADLSDVAEHAYAATVPAAVRLDFVRAGARASLVSPPWRTLR